MAEYISIQENLIRASIKAVYGQDQIPYLRKWSRAVAVEVKMLGEKRKQKINLLIGIKDMKYFPDASTFMFFTDFWKLVFENAGKIATVGGLKNVERAQNTVNELSKKEIYANFESEEEALSWLTS